MLLEEPGPAKPDELVRHAEKVLQDARPGARQTDEDSGVAGIVLRDAGSVRPFRKSAARPWRFTRVASERGSEVRGQGTHASNFRGVGSQERHMRRIPRHRAEGGFCGQGPRQSCLRAWQCRAESERARWSGPRLLERFR